MRERLFPGDRIAAYVVLVALALVTVLPLLYMIVLALQSDGEVQSGDPVLWPAELHWDNFTRLFEAAPFGRFFLNSLVMAGAITVSHLIFDPLVGYVFAKMEFPGKRVAFVAVLSTLMVPFFVRMLPIYSIFASLGWIDSYQGLIVPFLMDAYGIFLMRQFIRPLPDELIEAARVDGGSELTIFRRVILPLTRPGIATVVIFQFLSTWNEFLIANTVLRNTDSLPLQPVLFTLMGQYSTNWPALTAGLTLSVVPVVIVYVRMQRQFVAGMMLGAVKN